MPAPIIKDSWSKAQPPSVYDIVRNPRAMYQKENRQQVCSTKDVLESTQARLNREILEKWHASAFRLPHDTFVVVAQVGKYLFLAVMLPPYIFFYGIPKWLLQVILPQSIIIVKNEFVRVGRFMSRISVHLTDLMKGILKQALGDAIRIFNRKARQFGRYAITQLKAMGKFAVLSLQRPIKRMQAPLIALKNQIKKLVLQNTAYVKKTWNRNKEKAKVFFNKIKNAITDQLRIWHQHTLHPLIQWMAPKVAFIRTNSKKLWNKSKKTSRKIAEKITSRTRTIVNASKVSANWVVAVVNDVVQPVIQWIIPALAFFRPLIDGQAKKAVQPIVSKGKRLRKKIEEITSETFEFFESIISDTAHYCSFKLLPPFIKWRNKKLDQERSFRQLVKAQIDRFNQVVTKLQHRVAGWLQMCLHFLQKFLQWLKEQLLSVPRRIGRRLIQSFWLVCHGVQKSWYGMRWLATFLWILFKYGMLLVQELASDIGQAISSRKIN